MNRWQVVAVMAALGVVAIALVLGSDSFDEAFLSNGAATFVGVLLGVPAALLLVALQRADEAKSELVQANHRKRDLLIAVRFEIRDNLKDLGDRMADPNAPWSHRF